MIQAVQKSYDFLDTSLTLLFMPSTAPDKSSALVLNQFIIYLVAHAGAIFRHATNKSHADSSKYKCNAESLRVGENHS